MLPPKNTSLQWPDRDDHLVIVEMLASSESAAWTTCLTYVSLRVSIQASHLPYDYWDDITQDVMLLIVRNLSAFHGHSRLSTWIIRIVRNCTARFYRDYLFLPSLTDSLSNPSTRKKLHALQLSRKTAWTLEEEWILHEELRSACAELVRYIKTHPRPHQRTRILEAVLLDHTPLPVVAAELHCSVETVRNVVRAAQKYVCHKLLVKARYLVRRSARRTTHSRRNNGLYPL